MSLREEGIDSYGSSEHMKTEMRWNEMYEGDIYDFI